MAGGLIAGKKAGKLKRRHNKGKDNRDESLLSREEGLSLLHDIDTAFGLKPEGGAYKESNFYYGPSIYDYY